MLSVFHQNLRSPRPAVIVGTHRKTICAGAQDSKIFTLPDPFEFSLPGETPKILLDIGRGEQELRARLDTVSIRPDDLEVDLIWRGAYVYEGYSWLPHMKRLYAEVH